MIQTLSLLQKILAYNLYKKLGWPKVLPTILTLSVNDWCNARCKTCNIWKNNPREEINKQLKLVEYEKIFHSYGKTHWITITGGEPFLRKDLPKLIKIVYEKTKPNFISITTNGILTNKIFSDVNKILKCCPKTNLIINISLDGIGKQHDEIRRVKGNFSAVVKTFQKLKRLKNARLTTGINTVLSKYNVKNFQEIHDYIKNLNPDSFIVEIAENRAKLYNLNLKIMPRKDEYKKVLNILINDGKREYNQKTQEIVRKLRTNYYKFLLNGEPEENFEGIASGYIMSNGKVWISDSKKLIVGDLRDMGYDFKKIWFSQKAGELRKVMNKRYSTLLANAFYTNFICGFSLRKVETFIQLFIDNVYTL